MEWYHDMSKLHQLALAIEAVEAPPLLSDFLEKPWKWSFEWEYLQKHGNLKGYDGE